MITLLMARIEALVGLVSELRIQNGKLRAENKRLRQHIESQGFRESLYTTLN
jgi:hypothetical protein